MSSIRSANSKDRTRPDCLCQAELSARVTGRSQNGITPVAQTPPIDAAAAASNPVAGFFAAYRHGGEVRKPIALYSSDGTSLLTFAFGQIEKDWGSVNGYLKAEVGVGPKELARLRKQYTE